MLNVTRFVATYKFLQNTNRVPDVATVTTHPAGNSTPPKYPRSKPTAEEEGIVSYTTFEAIVPPAIVAAPPSAAVPPTRTPPITTGAPSELIAVAAVAVTNWMFHPPAVEM